MFARNVSIQLKPSTTINEFSKTMSEQVLPLLRKQKGFRDEIALTHDNTSVNAISLWDSKEAAEAYDTSAYPEVLKSMDKLIEGAPKVRTYDVVHSTYHLAVVNAAAAAPPASVTAPSPSKVAV
jgi:heme-degrading monooxygenase HmoA